MSVTGRGGVNTEQRAQLITAEGAHLGSIQAQHASTQNSLSLTRQIMKPETKLAGLSCFCQYKARPTQRQCMQLSQPRVTFPVRYGELAPALDCLLVSRHQHKSGVERHSAPKVMQLPSTPAGLFQLPSQEEECTNSTLTEVIAAHALTVHTMLHVSALCSPLMCACV